MLEELETANGYFAGERLFTPGGNGADNQAVRETALDSREKSIAEKEKALSAELADVEQKSEEYSRLSESLKTDSERYHKLAPLYLYSPASA